MFRRELYRAMGRVLEALDADMLARTSVTPSPPPS